MRRLRILATFEVVPAGLFGLHPHERTENSIDLASEIRKFSSNIFLGLTQVHYSYLDFAKPP